MIINFKLKGSTSEQAVNLRHVAMLSYDGGTIAFLTLAGNRIPFKGSYAEYKDLVTKWNEVASSRTYVYSSSTPESSGSDKPTLPDPSKTSPAQKS